VDDREDLLARVAAEGVARGFLQIAEQVGVAARGLAQEAIPQLEPRVGVDDV